MSTGYIISGIAVMALVTYLIRMLPFVIFRKKITNVRVKSFLYYVPYVTLAVMTFPAIINATQTPVSGILALIVGIVTAAFGFNLIKVAVSCCVTVFVAEFVLINLLHMV